MIAIVLGLCYNWKLGLVCAVFFPLLIGAVMLEMRITMGVDSVEKKAFEDSAKLAIEAITNIRTVAGKFFNLYQRKTYEWYIEVHGYDSIFFIIHDICI